MTSSLPQNAHIDLPVTKHFLEEKILAKVKVDAKLEALGDYYRIDEGGGFLSYITCVPLIWDKELAELPKSVVVKALTTTKLGQLVEEAKLGENSDHDHITTQAGFATSIHRNECIAYNFYELHKPRFPIPQVFWAQENVPSANQQGLIIMENFVGRAGCMDAVTGFSIETVEKLIDSIAEIQAFGFEHPDLVNSVEMAPREFLEPLFQGTAGMFAHLKTVFPDEFGSFDSSEVNRLASVDYLFDTLIPGGKHFNVTPVLVHGDLWINNILFHKENGKLINDVAAIIDWQAVHAGCPGDDLARVLITSVDGSLRREYETRWIDRYYSKLTELMGKGLPFTREDAHKWYGRAFLVQAMTPMLFSVLGQKMGCSPNEIKAKMMDARYALEDGLKFLKEVDESL